MIKANYLLFFFLLFLLTSCKEVNEGKDNTNLTESKIEVNDNMKLLRHVVLFNFSDAATAEIVKKIEQKFIGLKDEISEIHSFEWGTNNSPEGLDKGLTHCFFVTFLTEEDRTKYLPHPAHQAFVKYIGPYVEDVTVVDYWTQ